MPKGSVARVVLLLFALAATLATAPIQAGTVDDPEVVDAAGDADPSTAAIGDRDLAKVWIQDTLVDGKELVFAAELADDIQQATAFYALHERIRIAFVPTNAGGLPAGAVEAYVNLRLGFVQQGAPAESAACSFGTTTAVGGSRGVSTEAAGVASFTGAHYECRIPTSLIGDFDPAKGHKITGLYAQIQLVQRGPVSGTIPDDPLGVNVLTTYDRAPDSGAGRDFPAGTYTPPPNPNDTDGDGLNDTCEQTYFGGLNSTHNATGDADGDGLSNQHECGLGTDPTKADTDGDGTSDKDDLFPTDPTRGGSGNTTSNTTSTSKTNSTTNTTTSQSSTTTSSSATTSDAGSIESLDDAIEALKSDLGYLGGSAGGLLAVLVLCILGLAVRWSL